MNQPQHELEQLLHRLDALDDVPDSELEALDQRLEQQPVLRDQWAARQPSASEPLTAAAPEPAAWQPTWERIASASGPHRRLQLGVWQPLTAAACVALLAMTLQFSISPLATVRLGRELGTVAGDRCDRGRVGDVRRHDDLRGVRRRL